MHQEIHILGWGAVLLLVHIFAAVHYKTKQYGTDWNVGARDAPMPPLDPIPARLERARDNFLETLPIAIIALAGVVIEGRESILTAVGGWLWLGARIVYLPLYWTGVKGLRTAAFMVSLIGLGMALWPLLFP